MPERDTRKFDWYRSRSLRLLHPVQDKEPSAVATLLSSAAILLSSFLLFLSTQHVSAWYAMGHDQSWL
jgi:hypothetical protein